MSRETKEREAGSGVRQDGGERDDLRKLLLALNLLVSSIKASVRMSERRAPKGYTNPHKEQNEFR